VDEDPGIGERPAVRPLWEAVRELEAREIRQAMVRTGGNKKRAAEMLGIDYKTLLGKLRAYGIRTSISI
jgi:DNA-binding NtrC family response regulator